MVHAISTKTSLIYHRKAVSVEPTDRNIKAFCFFEFIAFSSTLNHLLKNFFLPFCDIRSWVKKNLTCIHTWYLRGIYMYIRIEYSFTRIKYRRPDGVCGTTRSQAGKIEDSCSDVVVVVFLSVASNRLRMLSRP